MLRKTQDLTGFKLGARDGEIGHVKDFYFDDEHWTIRYIVADTGNWLPKRKVLLSPFAVTAIMPASDRTIKFSLTRQQIEQSPSIESDKPVSRQFEEQYYRYYGWPYYSPGPLLWGPYPYPGATIPPNTAPPPRTGEQPEGDPHLRSANEVKGYHLLALDDEFGHVDDLIMDDHDWVIRYFIVNTGNWWPGKKVLLPPQWLSSVSWARSRVHVDLDRDTIKRAPEYDPEVPLTRDFEDRLFRFYNRQPYWLSEPEPAHAQ